MPNVGTRVILFLSSYAPLFVMIAARGWRDSHYGAAGLSAVAVCSVAILTIFLRRAQTLAANRVAVASVVSRDNNAMSYIVSYLLPFFAVKLNDARDLTSLGIFVLVIGLLYVNSNMIYVNPVLNLAGYHIFEIQDAAGKGAALICRRAYIRTGAEVEVIAMGDYVYLEKSRCK